VLQQKVVPTQLAEEFVRSL